MYIPKNRVFWSVSLGHMTNDIFMSMGPVLLAFIGGIYMEIPAFQIGIAVSARQMLGAISQPVFGWLSDKGNSRLLGAGGVSWTVAMLMLSLVMALTGNFWLMIIPYALSAVGSGAFHPVGTAYASHKETDRASTVTAYFFLFGQLGLALGPALAGFLLGLTQVNGEGGNIYPIFALALVSVPAVLLMSTSIPLPQQEREQRAAEDAKKAAIIAEKPQEPVKVGALMLLGLLVALRGFAYPGSVAFIPVLFEAKGWEPAAYGGITSVFWMASALAGVYVGGLADRFNRRYVVLVSLLLAAPTYFFLPLSDGILAYGLVLAAGIFGGGPHSIIVVLAQSLLPGRKGFASGVTLGFIFGMGAVGTLLIGYAADGFAIGGLTFAGFGLERTFQMIGGFVLLSALLAPLLPSSKPRIVKDVSPRPAPASGD